MNRHLIVSLIVLVASSACAQGPATAGDDPASEAVARFAGEVMTRAELDEGVESQLMALRQQEYDIKRQFLENAIYERLVGQAADKEGLTRAEYLKKNLTDKLGEPDEAAIQQVMNQYRARLNPDEEKARQQVVSYLKQQQQQVVQTALKERLFSEAEVVILLEPIRFEAELDNSRPSRGGDASAVVTIVEYTDFQCPYCSRVQPTLDEIMKRYGDNVRHVFKQLPLPIHGQAQLGAEASLCAGDQGKFWEMHDWLFANKSKINREALAEQATVLELDGATFAECLDQKTYAEAVKADMEEANSFGITGTPGFLVNGRPLRGAQPLEAFTEIIDEELRRAGIEPPKPQGGGEEAESGEAS